MNTNQQSVRLGAYIPESLDLKMRVFAAKNRTQISSVVSKAIEFYLNEHEAESNESL